MGLINPWRFQPWAQPQKVRESRYARDRREMPGQLHDLWVTADNGVSRRSLRVIYPVTGASEFALFTFEAIEKAYHEISALQTILCKHYISHLFFYHRFWPYQLRRGYWVLCTGHPGIRAGRPEDLEALDEGGCDRAQHNLNPPADRFGLSLSEKRSRILWDRGVDQPLALSTLGG